MPIYALDGIAPELPGDGSHWIAPNAAVIGRVRLEAGTGIWFGAVLRGDNELILIGQDSNIQEHCVLHTDLGYPRTVGKAFKSGWNGFVKVLAAILIFIGYTAPFLVILAIGGAIVIPINRRRRQLAAQVRQSRSTAPPPPPAPDAGQQTSERDYEGAARSQ